ncbi:hypothetical protein Q664_01205 [Archangium violaceum Cb vi76]|uniref:Uncharacterized protein n=1 Tax=Archangium violaceum Cb vi76 TaxID=1406225 RepID=A0A084T1U6_9BACT|nr:hypothetical protein Q664_01205 [Archangium violaceum Cb vi76]
MLLTACPGPDTDPNPNPNPDPGGGSTFTVAGKVLAGEGQPIEGTSILIPGNGRQAVALDSTGSFSIEGVTAPYDVIVVQRAHRSATVYKGLSRRDPTLPFITNAEETGGSKATLEGTITGGSTPYDDDVPTHVEFVSANGSGGTEASPEGTYSTEVNWSGSSSITGSLFAIQLESSSPFLPPTGYLGYGRRDNVTLNAGTTSSAIDVAMNSVTSARLAGTITAPADYALAMISVGLMPEQNINLDLFRAFETSSAFDYVVPNIPQSTLSMEVMAVKGDVSDPENGAISILYKKGLTAGTSNAALVLQEPSRPGQPADGATVVTRTTEFSWTAFTGGIHMVQFQEKEPAAGTSPYTVSVFTSGTQTTLPDLSTVDMGLPANTRFTWRVQGIAPVASMNALGDLALINPMRGTTDFTVGTSEARTFTTSAAP